MAADCTSLIRPTAVEFLTPLDRTPAKTDASTLVREMRDEGEKGAYYLGVNILVTPLTPEPLGERAADFLQNNLQHLIVGDFAAAEFASAIAKCVRTRGNYR